MYLIKTSTLLFVFLLLQATNSYSQDLGSWSVYSSFSTVNSIAYTNDGEIFASTFGGIFSVSNNQIESFYTTIDGMHRLDPSNSIFDDDNNRLIFTYPDGTIDLLNVENGVFEKNEDISRVDQFPSKGINEILLETDELFVATDFGIVVFTLDGFFVNTNILKLGSFERGISVNDINISEGVIYCATDQGVATADINSNLLDASSWTNYSIDDGFLDEIINKIVHFDSETYVLSNNIVYTFNGATWESTTIFGDSGVQDFYLTGSELVVNRSSSILVRSLGGNQEILSLDNNQSALSANIINGSIYVGTSDQGLIEFSLSDLTIRNEFLPDGPFLNFFSNLKFLDNTLISTSSVAFPQSDPFNSIRGYYLFEDNKWVNYNIRTNEALNTTGFQLAFTLANTSTDYYFGSWGEGILRHNIESNTISIFNDTNSGLTGISDSRSYIVIAGMDGDSNDNLWATSFDSDNPLNVQLSGSDDWLNFRKVNIPTDNLYFNLFIDSNDQKWISLVDFNYNGKGLLVLDTNDTEDASDDVYRKLTSTSTNGNLPDEFVSAIVEDKNGEVWIGTARGIARFIFPSFIVESSNSNDYQAQWLINEDTSAISRFLLRDVNVSTIAVNEANEKWIGSVNQGIWVVNEEGSRIEHRYTKDNSPLISNNILSITINDETGEVFIATDLGLVSFRDLPTTPVNKMDELKVFPNPFSYARNSQIIIEGLTETTTIKILGVDGTVVQELETRGGRVSWNGFDFQGNRLGTGVYFVVALERDGSEKGIGKVVIIK